MSILKERLETYMLPYALMLEKDVVGKMEFSFKKSLFHFRP